MRSKKMARKAKRANLTTLSINARNVVVGAYGMASLDPDCFDGREDLVDAANIITDSRRSRKKGTYLSR